MATRQRPPWTRPHRSREPEESNETSTYNIIPLYHHNLLIDHPSLINFPELPLATSALRAVENIRIPPSIPWKSRFDLLDWLGAFFGFQVVNVSNQREHLLLHLANAQTRLHLAPQNTETLHPSILRTFRRKLLRNYTRWCSFTGRESNLWISGNSEQRLELLYVALYLLIWGESANLRFIPGLICYIFHHMAMELNKIVGNYIDQETGRPCSPSISGENAFLNCIVTPIYQVIKAEFGNSSNYDEINKYFWSRRCLGKLKWPIDVRSKFFRKGKRVWNIGFVMPNLHTKLYSIYSSILSMRVGLFNNLDEIQNMQQLRLNFRFLARAMEHNLMSNPRGSFKGKFKKVESNKVEAEKLTLVWNEIIWALREEDRVSDHEVEVLELPENTWNVRVVGKILVNEKLIIKVEGLNVCIIKIDV